MISILPSVRFGIFKIRFKKITDLSFSPLFFFLFCHKGFVNKLDEFIQWLNEAMETTENWTPPKAETDSLKLYLETHLVGKIVLLLLSVMEEF